MQAANHDGLLPMVYSVYYPETHKIIDQLSSPFPHNMYEQVWKETPTTPSYYRAFLGTWRRWSCVNLGADFPNSYATAGSSEAINYLIGRTTRQGGRIHVFTGEYDGYRHLANAWGATIFHHSRNLDDVLKAEFKPGDAFWISQPSGIDGEYWADFDTWAHAMAHHHPKVEIYLDVAYQGVVKRPQHLYPCGYPNIEAIVFSLSKPFGVYFHRIGGAMSRRPILMLEGHKDFHNRLSVSLGCALMESFALNDLPKKYARLQELIVTEHKLQGTLPSDTVPCNVVLLARSHAAPPFGDEALKNRYRRSPDTYRYNLTPDLYRHFSESEVSQ